MLKAPTEQVDVRLSPGWLISLSTLYKCENNTLRHMANSSLIQHGHLATLPITAKITSKKSQSNILEKIGKCLLCKILLLNIFLKIIFKDLHGSLS